MRLLNIDGDDMPTVLLFGLGLVGGAVDRAMHLRFSAKGRDLAYDWHDAELRRAQREAIAAALPDGKRVALLWAGGSGGFGSSSEEMAGETQIVGELIDWAQQLQPGWSVDFHLTSSAGGLFEGQRHCSASSRPAPLRPYGEGKLEQEKMLLAASFRRRHIYRPSSIYGVGRSKRVGLATMLAINALKGGTTRIYGNPNTLRDYVLADDIGRFIARRIVSPGGAHDVLTLASGRPVSVHEMIELVRDRVSQPVLVQFDPYPFNARDMSFLPSSLPSDWRPTALATGVAQVVDRLSNRMA
jgi:UDP-glucose 4-epimerase